MYNPSIVKLLRICSVEHPLVETQQTSVLFSVSKLMINLITSVIPKWIKCCGEMLCYYSTIILPSHSNCYVSCIKPGLVAVD